MWCVYFPDSKAELDKFEEVWSTSERAKAVDQEIAKRHNTTQQDHGYLLVCPSDKVSHNLMCNIIVQVNT